MGTRIMFEELGVGDTFAVHPEEGSALYMRMSTGNDALAITGENSGRVYEWPGWSVFHRPILVASFKSDGELDAFLQGPRIISAA